MSHISAHNANVILRLHDSFRFEKAYLRQLQELGSRHPNVMLKFKDKSPDNYLDMQVSDILISNFSSIANLFYATGRPSIHVYPVRDADEAFTWRRLSFTGVKKSEVEKARFIWKLAPEENGGLLARSFTELKEQIDQAFDDPACCEVASRDFLDKYMLGADGKSCERIYRELSALVNRERVDGVL